MKKITPLAHWLTLIGAVLVWLPVVFPVFLTISYLVMYRVFHFDFLMPAEWFILFFPGSLLLYAAALQLGHLSRNIGMTTLAAFLALAASQVTAVITGLASGAREATGWPLILTLSFLGIYTILVVRQGTLSLTQLQWIKANSR